MKKFMSLAVALVAAVVVSSSAFAASTQFTARATFAGVADFSFTLKNLSNDQTATDLIWTEADAFNTTDADSWVKAQQYAEVVANITKANAKVLMFTENKVTWPALEPNYTKWNGSGDDAVGVEGTEAYGGLVRNENGNLPSDFKGAYRGYIPVAFSYNSQKDTTVTFNGPDDEGNTITTPTRADRFLSEKANPSYSDDYALIAAFGGPIFGVDSKTGPWPGSGITDNKAYMYFFGNFKNIKGGDTYSTTVKVQQSWE